MLIETKRLLLREWQKSDLDPMAIINQDPKVMEFFPSIRTYTETEKFINANISAYEKYGYCLYPVELKASGELIGFVGLNYTDWQAHFTPAVEIGWRLGAQFWGQGYATEAAMAVRDFAFNTLNLDELVSFTVPANVRSRKLMERLGFIHDPKDDFDHPMIDVGHPMKRHVLYRLRKDQL